MSSTENIKHIKQKTYTVEILALFEIQLDHHFSNADIQDAGGLITDTFDFLISEIVDDFSSLYIDIEFESAKRRRKDNIYKFSGSIKRCYGFPERDVYECELVDGVSDMQLDDMKIAVESACDMSGYELNIVHFGWADDEVIE